MGEFLVSVSWRAGYVFWRPIAIRVEEKGEGFENGNCFWQVGLAFNPNHSLQSLTRFKMLQKGYMIYEDKIQIENIDLAYS
jgi:hypothetical protein